MALMTVQEANNIKSDLLNFIHRITAGEASEDETALLPEIIRIAFTYFCDDGYLPNLTP